MKSDDPTPVEWDQAIRLLAGMIPKEISANILMLMQNKQTPWHQSSHFGLLREAGYNWSDIYLDDHWHELVDETAQIANWGW
jgi:hypothetical protein